MKQIIYLFILILVMAGCSLDIPLEDQVSDPDAVTTVVAAEKLLASAYKSYVNYENTVDFTLMSDDFQPTQLLKQDVNLKWIYNWSENGIVPLAEAEWDNNYTTIMNCNALLARLPNITPVSEEEEAQLQQIKNRAIRLKAICFFRLLQIFAPAVKGNGDALGIIIKDKVEKTETGRVTINESIAYIENLLQQTAPSDFKNSSSAWMSADAEEYLKAELAMWKGDYEKVIATAKPLYEQLKQEAFSPMQFSNLWNNMASEARVFYRDISDKTGTYFYLSISSNNEKYDYAVVNEKIKYHKDDIRKGIYSDSTTMFVNNFEPNKHIWRFGKYYRLDRAKIAPKYFEKYRVAGLVFLLAEAYAQQGSTTEALAVLNHFLMARKATAVSGNLTQQQLIRIILHEKQKEFIGEGVRFFDLKRNPQILQRYSMFNKKSKQIKPDDYRWVFPIPVNEIRHNPACKQNSGWEHIK